MSAAWGWKPATDNRLDGRWSLARRLLLAGIILLTLMLVEVCLILAAAYSAHAM